MTPGPSRRLAPAIALLLAGLAAAAAPAAAAPRMLPDSTWAESWQLSNGLRVVTLDIPRASAVAITVGYPFGGDADPPGRPGLAQLMAEVEMMGPAGDVPERNRTEMESLRPLGWSLKVNPRSTQLSELATPEQFPGALRQVAQRLRGVSVPEDVLKTALASVHRDRGQDFLGPLDQALYYQVRAYAAGADPSGVVGLAAAKPLDAVSARELEERIHATFVPAGAVLALAGNLGGLNLHALVDGLFSAIPAGTPPALPKPPAFHPSLHTVERADVDRPIGTIAVQAPALTDSLHPQFFLCMLIVGEWCHQSWPVSRQVSTRFRYSILDEPDLVRFVPDTERDSTQARVLRGELMGSLADLLGLAIMNAEYDRYRTSVIWLLGGAMTPRLLAQVRTDGPSLNNVCSGLAARELTGGEAFWSRYRARFLDRREPGLSAWSRYLVQPEHQVGLLFTPHVK
ncbi:MAG TPA: hypothetical protein VI792_08200 [Candidatus Eisenbacteria bacterium]